jgi:predicted DNA-binding protein (MmcQ/YjbR family)
MFEDRFFSHKNLNTKKLLAYGFKEIGEGYEYSVPILNSDFTFFVTVTGKGEVTTRVVERDTSEEYILYRTEGAVGSFVGEVREACGGVLSDISEKCFDRYIFKSRQATEIIEYVRKKYGDELEFLWEKFPADAICRRKDSKKWYVLLMTVAGYKFGFPEGVNVEVIDLRISPEKVSSVVDNVRYFGGYHMNKKSWYTIILDNGVPTEDILKGIDESFILAC